MEHRQHRAARPLQQRHLRQDRLRLPGHTRRSHHWPRARRQPGPARQLVGNSWFSYATRYGFLLTLALHPAHQPEDDLPAVLEQAPTDPASYKALAQTCLDAHQLNSPPPNPRHNKPASRTSSTRASPPQPLRRQTSASHCFAPPSQPRHPLCNTGYAFTSSRPNSASATTPRPASPSIPSSTTIPRLPRHLGQSSTGTHHPLRLRRSPALSVWRSTSPPSSPHPISAATGSSKTSPSSSSTPPPSATSIKARPTCAKALNAALAPRFTVGGSGLTWSLHRDATFLWYSLDGPKHLTLAIDGNRCILASDPETLQQLITASHAAPLAPHVASTIAGFSWFSERAPLARITTLLDNPMPSGNGSAPTFFSGNIGSLGTTFQDLASQTFTESPTADRTIHQSVLYRWKR